MTDKTTKLLLLLIAIGLLLNAAALFTRTAVTPAYAADNRVYLEGGTIQVKIDQPLRIKLEDDIKVNLERMSGFDSLAVTVKDIVRVKQQ